MGTFTTRIIRACLRPAATAASSSGKAVMAMMVSFLLGDQGHLVVTGPQVIT
jgi:hypothetical protein